MKLKHEELRITVMQEEVMLKERKKTVLELKNAVGSHEKKCFCCREKKKCCRVPVLQRVIEWREEHFNEKCIQPIHRHFCSIGRCDS